MSKGVFQGDMIHTQPCKLCSFVAFANNEKSLNIKIRLHYKGVHKQVVDPAKLRLNSGAISGVVSIARGNENAEGLVKALCESGQSGQLNRMSRRFRKDPSVKILGAEKKE